MKEKGEGRGCIRSAVRGGWHRRLGWNDCRGGARC